MAGCAASMQPRVFAAVAVTSTPPSVGQTVPVLSSFPHVMPEEPQLGLASFSASVPAGAGGGGRQVASSPVVRVVPGAQGETAPAAGTLVAVTVAVGEAVAATPAGAVCVAAALASSACC